jgi:glycosyltransferase involved in cell wall biosynthesis
VRIALVVHKFPPTSLGGTETYTYNLAHELTKRGHAVSVFYRDDEDGSRFREGWQSTEPFRVWRVGRAFAPSKVDPARLFFDTFLNRDVETSFQRFLVETQPDLVHFQHLMLLSVRLPALVEALGIPMLLTLHDYWFRCANSQLIWPDGQICRGKLCGVNCARCATTRISSNLIRAFHPVLAPLFQWRDWLVKRAALRVGQFLAPSHFLREKYLAVGFPGGSFEVLENGLNVARIRSFPRSPERDRLRLTYLGSLAWQKGVHVLLEAIRGLPADRIRLRVYGNIGTFPEYVTRLKALIDPRNTSLEGVIPNAQVGRVLAETDLLAVPSLWYENSPVVIQEAFAAGVPVLASRLGALTEKVRNEVDGKLVAAGDVPAWRSALKKLLSDPIRLSYWRSNVRDPMSIGEHVEKMEQYYLALQH